MVGKHKGASLATASSYTSLIESHEAFNTSGIKCSLKDKFIGIVETWWAQTSIAVWAVVLEDNQSLL